MGHATSDEGRSSSPSSSADDRSFTLAADAAIEYTPDEDGGHPLTFAPGIPLDGRSPCPVSPWTG